jgi:hypothetical protein
MALPLVTQAQIVNALMKAIPKTYRIEIFSDFPSDADIVRYGIYVSTVYPTDRSPYQLGIATGGNIYTVQDTIDIIYVSFQDDQHLEEINNIISGLVDYTLPLANQQLFDGYHERDYVQSVAYGPQSEKFTWQFNLKRLEFQ